MFDGFEYWLLGVMCASALVSVSSYFLFFSDWRPFMQTLFIMMGAGLDIWFNLVARQP